MTLRLLLTGQVKKESYLKKNKNKKKRVIDECGISILSRRIKLMKKFGCKYARNAAFQMNTQIIFALL